MSPIKKEFVVYSRFRLTCVVQLRVGPNVCPVTVDIPWKDKKKTN